MKFQEIIQNEVSLGGSPTTNVTLLLSVFQYFFSIFPIPGPSMAAPVPPLHKPVEGAAAAESIK